jgi:hypothetical protein
MTEVADRIERLRWATWRLQRGMSQSRVLNLAATRRATQSICSCRCRCSRSRPDACNSTPCLIEPPFFLRCLCALHRTEYTEGTAGHGGSTCHVVPAPCRACSAPWPCSSRRAWTRAAWPVVASPRPPHALRFRFLKSRVVTAALHRPLTPTDRNRSSGGPTVLSGRPAVAIFFFFFERRGVSKDPETASIPILSVTQLQKSPPKK